MKTVGVTDYKNLTLSKYLDGKVQQPSKYPPIVSGGSVGMHYFVYFIVLRSP